MSPRRRWTFLWILVPLLIVLGFGVFLVQHFFDPVFYKRFLQESLSQALGREVSIGEARISLWEGVGITFEDFRVRDRALPFDLLHSKRFILRAKLLPLLRREVQWKRIVLDEPTVHLQRNPDGRTNFIGEPLTDGKSQSSQKLIQIITTFFGGSVTVREGRLLFTDQALGGDEIKTEIASFFLQISTVSYRDPFPFRMSGRLVNPGHEGRFLIYGTLKNIPEDLDLSKGVIEAKAELKEIHTSLLWPYLKQVLPARKLEGVFTLSGEFHGTLAGDFQTTAKFNMREMILDYPQVFSYLHTPKWLNVSIEAEGSPKEIRASQIVCEIPEIRVQARGRIYGIGTKDMGLEAEAKSGPFDLGAGKRLIPFRIITADVSDALFRAEGSGPVQILSVKLSGKIPEIDHCDEFQNAHVLSVELKLGGVRLKLPWNLPPLEGLQGLLVFKNGHLFLSPVEGKVYQSTLEKVRGTFFELLHVPKVDVQTGGLFEIRDLHALSKTDLFPEDVVEALTPFQFQSGKARYTLTVRGSIRPPYRFQHHGTYHLSQARFTHSQIPFPIQVGEGRIELSNTFLRWWDAKVEGGQSSFTVNGVWHYGEKAAPLEAALRGRVDFKDLHRLSQSSLFPEKIRLMGREMETVSGNGQLSLTLKSPSDISPLSLEGQLIPKDLSIRRRGMTSAATVKEGAFSFSDRGVGFSGLKALFLNTSLFLDGDVKSGKIRLLTRASIDLSNLPALFSLSFFPDSVRSLLAGVRDLKGMAEGSVVWQGKTAGGLDSLREGQLRLKGVSFSHPKFPLPVSQMEGLILLTPNQYRFQTVRGRIGETQVMASGTVPKAPGLSRPLHDTKKQISVGIVSPFLDLDLLLPPREKQGPTSFEGLKDWLSQWQTDGSVEAVQVKYQGSFYQDLKIELKTQEGRLHLNPFQFKGAGGDFWSEGWVEPAGRGIRFHIKPRVSNMEARAFMRILSPTIQEEKMVYSGRIHIDKVELHGEGEDFQKIKASLNGGLRFEIEHGAIEKANLLAKIFSLLNVTQYFKGKLPDLKTKGLPFQSTLATFQIKDGIASFEDFLVDSEAMRISGVGKIDLGKNQIDAKIGVHPLVTVDTVLSKIPIAGYILTGKDKAFLSFVYDVKGDLDDPKVEAVPVQSVPGGVFGILKRILETPIRPFKKLPARPEEGKD